MGEAAGVGLGVLAPLEGTLQPRYHSQFLCTTCGCGTGPFCVSVPPTSLDVASLIL